MDSPKEETEGTSTWAVKNKEKFSHKEEVLRLIGIRDFISLLLTYPVKLEEEGKLKAWINAFNTQWRPKLLTTDDEYGVNVTEKPWHVLTGKALKCMEGFMPMEIISQIEHSGRPIFYHQNDVPGAILNLTGDLAVEQLIQTLFSRDDYVRYVRLSTRHDFEKLSVFYKITAALEDIHNLFGIDKHFLRALWIDASKYESDAEVQVQQQINAVMAGMVTQGVEEEIKSNKYLVILVDRDGNKRLDPTKVHFPDGTVVLITTETELSAQAEEGDDEFTITCTMDLNIRTRDHLLSWEVFCSYVGSDIEHWAIQRIAVQIVKECHGHLLAIVLVAKFLKNVEQWEPALVKLRCTNPFYQSDLIGISKAMVNVFINIIWEGMKKTQKLCLELSLFVHNIKTGVPRETLMSNWFSTELSHKHEVAQRLFPFGYGDARLEYTMEKACYDINEIIGRSILFESGSSGYVRLPIETYDIIESIHKLNPSIIRGGALGLTELPYIGRWHGLIRIELMDNQICELPQSPICPKLTVLLLQGNADLMDIPDLFFNHMPLLEYLDLSYTSIKDFPPSISRLVELKKFYLRGCDLFMELPPEIGHLKNLEELDLDGTLITHLPEEIRQLINLKSLTLCFEGYYHAFGHGKEGKQISNSTIIPPGVISNLIQLNYLSINVDTDDERWNEDVLSILLEILGLERLKRVSIYIPKVEFLELIPSHTSLDFRLIVGHHMRRFISRVTPQVEEKFKHCDHSIKFVNGINVPNGVKMHLERFKALYLDRHMTIKSLSEFKLKNLYILRVCILAECNEMETIVGENYSDDKNALPNLEFLSVFYMKNLRSIYQGTTPPRLQCLKTIALHTCPMLTSIFTSSLLCNLSLLEELIIEDCPKVTTLISHGSSEHETQIYLPRLRKILLLYLPEFVSIFNGLHVEHGLEIMGFYYCPKLQTLSKSELSSKDLRVIKGEGRWWKALKWDKAEWGCADRPNFINGIFFPINEEADIMSQLAAHDKKDQFVITAPALDNRTVNILAPDLDNRTVNKLAPDADTSVVKKLAPDVDTSVVNKLAKSVDFEKFTWRIEDFSKQNAVKLRSKAFKIDRYKWRILVYPLRKDVNHFSLYLMVADSLPPYGWSRNTFFKLALINQVDSKKSIVKESQQKFRGGYRSWGSFFLNLNDFYDHKQGYLVRDTCIIEAHICVSEIQDINSLNPNSTPIHDSILGDQESGHERETIITSGSSPREGEIDQGSDLTLRELIDLESLRPEEETFIPLLEEVCIWHPSLIQNQMRRSRWFRQWAFTSLGQVLHFLKTKKVKDINEEDCKNLQSLWEDLVKSSGFDLAWLEPYVQSALDVKANLEGAQRLKKLKDKVFALEIKMKKLRGELAAAEAEFEVARKGLSQVRKGFQEMDVNAPIGYSMS